MNIKHKLMAMRKNNSIFKEIFNVMSSNFIFLLSSIFTGFIIPKLLGTTNYGYYKTFSLYSSYIALLHFGYIDGIILKHGGNNYSNLNKYNFRSNTVFFIIFQCIISILLISISLIINDMIYKIIFISLGIYAFLFNVTTYYQYVSQATMRFSELSFRKTLQSILTIIFIFILWLFYKLKIISNPNFFVYIFIILLIYFILLIWYIYTYRDITFGKKMPIFNNLSKIFSYFKSGFFLTMSFQVSTLILNLDSQFISIFFKSTIFGIYSFAYSLISMILSVLNAISTVLFPHMQRSSMKYLINIYPKLMSYIEIIVYLLLLGYFPLNVIIQIILPEYSSSLNYFRILLPGVGINCSITLIIFNYFNVLHKSKLYFYVNIFVLIFAVILDFITYIVFKSPIALAFSSLLSLLIWYILSEFILIKWYKVKWIKNFVYMILMIILFIIISYINSIIIGFILYFIIYLIITIIMYKRLIENLFFKIISKL